MQRIFEIGASALVTGSIASIVSTVALAALASSEGKSAVQPTNATSHWAHGDVLIVDDALAVEQDGLGAQPANSVHDPREARGKVRSTAAEMRTMSSWRRTWSR